MIAAGAVMSDESPKHMHSNECRSRLSKQSFAAVRNMKNIVVFGLCWRESIAGISFYALLSAPYGIGVD